jgi:hypothetical protein
MIGCEGSGVIGVFWLLFLLVAVSAAVGLGLSFIIQRAVKRSAAKRRRVQGLVARADYEDELWMHGDDHGIYGEYPPNHQGRVPELPDRNTGPRGPRTSPHPAPAKEPQQPVAEESRGRPSELEQQVAVKRSEAAQRRAVLGQAVTRYATQTAQEAVKGRALIDQFIAMMRKHNVSTETIYRKSKGPTTVTYDTVVGQGWAIGSGSLEQWRPFMAGQPTYRIYALPDLGLAKTTRIQLGQQTINVLVYPTEPDNSDQAYRAWADRGSELASRAQQLIDWAR